MTDSPLVLVSGPIGTGKSALGFHLRDHFGFRLVRTKDILQARAPNAATRRALSRLGNSLDKKTYGSWVADLVAHELQQAGWQSRVCVDAVRKVDQVHACRSAFGPRVVHVHLKAAEAWLDHRFSERLTRRADDYANYQSAKRDPAEGELTQLEELADVVIDVSQSTPLDVVTRAAARIGLNGSPSERLVDVVVGGQYGSEGKGHVVSYLAREYDLLVRVGGPNAGHKVISGGGAYTHHLLPSGTRTSEAPLLLAPGMVLRLDTLLKEIADCLVDQDRLAIDPQCMIIGDSDIAEESVLTKTIGSTGQGVGSATARRIMGRSGGVRLAGDIRELKPFLRPAAEVLARAYQSRDRILIEGTQGFGLSIYHGSYPHVTSRDTTVSGCLAEVGIPPARVRRIVMVVRTYPIRVESPKGKTSGPMSTEITWDEVAGRAHVNADKLRAVERTSTTNRARRVSEFDWTLLRRASQANGPSDIALTFADYIDVTNVRARRFEQLTPETIQFIEEVETVAAAPVTLISTRFHQRSIIDRRVW